MQMETKERVEEFIHLQQKKDYELRAICEGYGLSTEGQKPDLIDKLMEINAQPQKSILVAQALPLRTRDNSGSFMKQAASTYKLWRKLIFQGTANRRQFQLLNGSGQAYMNSMKYIQCTDAVLEHIFKNGWILPLEHHRDLITMLKMKPEKFEKNIVQKYDSQGNSWLMLHVAPLAA